MSLNPYLLNRSLKEFDPEIFLLNQLEIKRQKESLELIASENFASNATLTALSSHFNNKYSEGYPGHRYYGGNENVDKLELLTQKRALEAFNLDPNEWGVNVQALSGSSANLAVYTALVPPGGRLMGLLLSDGGHLTHGHRSKNKSISASSLFWQSMPYTVNPETSLIDYDMLYKNSSLYRPHIIIAGTSSYPRNINYELMKKISDNSNSILMADIAHVAGLISANLIPSPFNYCDIVTTTTHKTLRGSRGALIFYKKIKNNKNTNFESKINNSIFPCLQGGPHMHQIASIAVSLKETLEPEFKIYQKQILLNMKSMINYFLNNNIKLITNGSDNHLCLIDLRPFNIDGNKVELVLEKANIIVNKNTIPGDLKPNQPFGIRIGSPALTTRGFKENDFIKISKLIIKGIEISKKIQNNFKLNLNKNEEINKLKIEVINFAKKFPLPGLIE